MKTSFICLFLSTKEGFIHYNVYIRQMSDHYNTNLSYSWFRLFANANRIFYTSQLIRTEIEARPFDLLLGYHDVRTL